ncbi:hypothetical protein B0O99DRAFT_597143 [Bisporella sp. PMI_857]|nr:hypothetical protein B0O99DRAFT_597143 [Bisporella sp. PMI_857]
MERPRLCFHLSHKRGERVLISDINTDQVRTLGQHTSQTTTSASQSNQFISSATSQSQSQPPVATAQAPRNQTQTYMELVKIASPDQQRPAPRRPPGLHLPFRATRNFSPLSPTRMLRDQRYTNPEQQEINRQVQDTAHRANEVLKYENPAAYRRQQMVNSLKPSPVSKLPSVLHPKGEVIAEISYQQAIELMTGETGGMLMNLKLSPRPVDIVLYEASGSSAAVFSLILTKHVDLPWLVSWIQIFVDKWTEYYDHKDILVVQSIKIRVGCDGETDSYPPLKGTPMDYRQKTGPLKGFFFMKWDCRESEMEFYWEVYRSMLQMGDRNQQKPIFKVHTMGFTKEDAPMNLRLRDSLAPGQYFDHKGTDHPLMAEDYFAEANSLAKFEAMIKDSDATFEARKLAEKDHKDKQAARARKSIPSVSTNAPYKGAESYGVRGETLEAELVPAKPNSTRHIFSSHTIEPLLPEADDVAVLSIKNSNTSKHLLDKSVTLMLDSSVLNVKPGAVPYPGYKTAQKIYVPYIPPISSDPDQTWARYQKVGGDPKFWEAFPLDHIPFMVEDFDNYPAIPKYSPNGAQSDTGNFIDDTIASTQYQPASQVLSLPNIQDDKRESPISAERLEELRRNRGAFDAARSFDSNDDELYFSTRARQDPIDGACIEITVPRILPNRHRSRKSPVKKFSAVPPHVYEESLYQQQNQNSSPKPMVTSPSRRYDSAMTGFPQFNPTSQRAEYSTISSSRIESPIHFNPAGTEFQKLRSNASSASGMRPDAPSFQHIVTDHSGPNSPVKHHSSLNANAESFQHLNHYMAAPGSNFVNIDFSNTRHFEHTPVLNANAPSFQIPGNFMLPQLTPLHTEARQAILEPGKLSRTPSAASLASGGAASNHSSQNLVQDFPRNSSSSNLTNTTRGFPQVRPFQRPSSRSSWKSSPERISRQEAHPPEYSARLRFIPHTDIPDTGPYISNTQPRRRSISPSKSARDFQSVVSSPQPHLNALKNPQQQIQLPERPDRSRTFDRNSRPRAPSKGYIQQPQNPYLQDMARKGQVNQYSPPKIAYQYGGSQHQSASFAQGPVQGGGRVLNALEAIASSFSSENRSLAAAFQPHKGLSQVAGQTSHASPGSAPAKRPIFSLRSESPERSDSPPSGGVSLNETPKMGRTPTVGQNTAASFTGSLGANLSFPPSKGSPS